MLFTKINKTKNYTLQKNDSPYFLHQLQSKILLDNQVIGEMGIINPEVLKKQGLVYPTSYLEVNLELLTGENWYFIQSLN